MQHQKTNTTQVIDQKCNTLFNLQNGCKRVLMLRDIYNAEGSIIISITPKVTTMTQMYHNDLNMSYIFSPLIFNNEENHQRVNKFFLRKKKMYLIFFYNIYLAFTFQRLHVIVDSFWKKAIYVVYKKKQIFFCFLVKVSLLWNTQVSIFSIFISFLWLLCRGSIL